MHSKTSNQSKPQHPSHLELNCSEAELEKAAKDLAQCLSSGDRICLEGPMGAGKTTFARALLSALKIEQPAEGSPTFAIAHEYQSYSEDPNQPNPRVVSIVHIDFYRIRSDEEIDEAGIPAYYWERDAIVISEWLSSWPRFEEQVLKAGSGAIWKVELSFIEDLTPSSPSLLQPLLQKRNLKIIQKRIRKNLNESE